MLRILIPITFFLFFTVSLHNVYAGSHLGGTIGAENEGTFTEEVNPGVVLQFKRLTHVKSIDIEQPNNPITCGNPPGVCWAYALDFDKDGNLYVTNVLKTVMIFNRNGKFVKSWDVKSANEPWLRSIMIDRTSPNGKVYLTSQNPRHSDTIFVYDRNGNPTNRNIKFPGFAHYFLPRFDGTVVIADDRDDELELFKFWYFFPLAPGVPFVISDSLEDNFEVVGAEVKHLGTWKLDGQGAAPRQLSLDIRTGNVYVAARNQNRIQILDSNGNYLKSFKGANGEFNQPHGVLVDNKNNVVFVADTYNNRIQEFTLDGIFLRNYKFDRVTVPRFMVIGPDGRIYISSTEDKKVHVFEYKFPS